MTRTTEWCTLPKNLTDTTVGVIGTLLGTSVGLAGILLVFVGFAYARGEAFHDENRRDQYRNVVRAGFAFPFLSSMLCSWACVRFFQGAAWAYDVALLTFKMELVVVTLYAFVIVFMYL